jgi:hypothetical protein
MGTGEIISCKLMVESLRIESNNLKIPAMMIAVAGKTIPAPYF